MRNMIRISILLIALMLIGCRTDPPIETPIDTTPVESTPIETEIDPIEQLFMNSTQMNNYTMTILIYHKSEIYTLIIKMTENHASLEMEGAIEYFTKTDEMCKHYIKAHDGYVIEEIECADHDQMTFAFFEDFEVSWFSELNGKYYMNLQNHTALSNFFSQTIKGAVVSNFELILGDDYFEQFIFDMLVEDALYRLDVTFSDVDKTNIVLPSVR